jgi:hypothetical protein
MQKGQISFDFIITVGFFILFLQSFLAFSDGLMADNDTLNTRMQAEIIVKEIGQTILIGNTAAGASNVSISYDIPNVKAPSGKTINDCTITLSDLDTSAPKAKYVIAIDNGGSFTSPLILIPKLAVGFNLNQTIMNQRIINCKDGDAITYSK